MSRYTDWVEIARGTQGKVYKAIDNVNHAEVAIKIFSEDEDFQRERDILKSISPCNPHVLCFMDSFFSKEHQRWALVTEYIHGITVDEVFYTKNGRRRQSRGPQLSLIWIIWYQIIIAIQELHRLGITHMDAHKGNMIWTGGIIKLIDLGYSAFVQQYAEDIKEIGKNLTLIIGWPHSAIQLEYYPSEKLWGADTNPELAERLCTLCTMLLQGKSLSDIQQWMDNY